MFRLNKPASSHLNGKVERSQRTDKEEFYSTASLDLSELQSTTLPEGSTTTIGSDHMALLKVKHRWKLSVSI
jgi:hypothetical protein